MGAEGMRPEERLREAFEVFAYPEVAWEDGAAEAASRLAEVFGGESTPLGGLWSGDSGRRPDAAGASCEVPLLDADQVQALVAEASNRAEERGFTRGVERGITVAREEAQRLFAADRARLQAQAGELVEGFSAEKEQYFHQVEQEAVRLALAIAARILRREAQMDSLLLTGAVRVALGQLAETTTVRLRVPVADERLWREALALMPGLPLRPKVIADERMALGDCRMETELGSADLGLRAQLREIERGFFDRVGSTAQGWPMEPGSPPAASPFSAPRAAPMPAPVAAMGSSPAPVGTGLPDRRGQGRAGAASGPMDEPAEEPAGHGDLLEEVE